MAVSRASKLSALQRLADTQNRCLAEHPSRRIHGLEKSHRKGKLVGPGSIVTVTAADRHIHVEVDTKYNEEIAEVDGCYAIKTDLPAQVADKELIHDRYKDLAMVETAFPSCKTTQLEVRPVFVRTEANTPAISLW